MAKKKNEIAVTEFACTVAVFKLEKVLADKGVSQRTFMLDTQTSFDTVRNYKKGLITKPDMLVLDRWCEYLDCEPSDIIEFKRK